MKKDAHIGITMNISVPKSAGASSNQAAYFSSKRNFFNINPFTKISKYYNIVSMKKSHFVELILFIVLVAFLGFFGVKAFKHTFDIGTTYHLAFKDIYGIEIGSPVRILGVDIGHVTKIQHNYDEIYVDFVVTDNKVKLPEGTLATIEFFGIAGSRSIELFPPKGKVDAQGMLIVEPIRIGDAMDIMGEFGKAMMASVAGLYDFAKDRSTSQVERTTANFLAATNSADDKVVSVTNTIMNMGAELEERFTDTQRGMARINREAQALNASANVNRGKYAINLTRRYLGKFHRRIVAFKEYTQIFSKGASDACDEVQKVQTKVYEIDALNDAFEGLELSMEELNKNLTQENLDKVYEVFEEIRLKSKEVKDSL